MGAPFLEGKMPDTVKVIIGERNGVELLDNEEYVLIPENIPFSSPGVVSDNVKDAILETNGIAQAQRYPIILTHNGSVSNGTFLGYSSKISGDSSPIVIPASGTLKEFSFSNSKTSADFTLEFRKNSLTATPFFSVSKTNTQFFVQTGVDEVMTVGDRLYVKYVDNGTNANDAVVIIYILNEGI